jgi:hypothetical protein
MCARPENSLLADDARDRYNQLIANFGQEDEPVFQDLIEKANAALEELDRRGNGGNHK